MTKVWMLASFARVNACASGLSLMSATISISSSSASIIAWAREPEPEANNTTRAAISAFQDEANTGPEMHPGIVQLPMSV